MPQNPACVILTKDLRYIIIKAYNRAPETWDFMDQISKWTDKSSSDHGTQKITKDRLTKFQTYCQKCHVDVIESFSELGNPQEFIKQDFGSECSRCLGSGWELYAIENEKLEFTECEECYNPDNLPSP